MKQALCLPEFWSAERYPLVLSPQSLTSTTEAFSIGQRFNHCHITELCVRQRRDCDRINVNAVEKFPNQL